MAERKKRGDIISDITDRVAQSGGDYSEWFVGVTDTPRHTLFKVHMLRPNVDACITRHAKDEYEAAEVADYFRTVCHTKGSARASDGEVVYAYRMKPHTKP